jgi:ketosteroid isomerase-like protein
MDTDSNRQLAIEFYRRFSADDIPGVLELMAEDATFWIAGQPGSSPTAGLHDKPGIARIFRRMRDALEGPLRMRVENTTAEGDRVAVEASSEGTLKNGRAYRQAYHAVFTLSEGRIAAVREYMDTQHVQAVWYAA